MNSTEVTIVGLSVQELEEIIRNVIKELLPDNSKNSNTAETNIELVTRHEASKLINVSLPTLTKYVKQGIIPAHRIGNRVLFKKDEILYSLKNVQKQNFFY